LSDLDEEFAELLKREEEFPPELPDMKSLYTDFYNEMTGLTRNLVCASCGCINHQLDSCELVLTNYEPLCLLTVPVDINIPFDFSCGVDLLDEQRILLDKQGIVADKQGVVLCKSCYSELQNHHRPVRSLSNFRWVGPLPKELQDLTWLEEQLIARSHLIGNIVRLSARNASSYFAVKGHTLMNR
jgi:hypothetical protein